MLDQTELLVLTQTTFSHCHTDNPRELSGTAPYFISIDLVFMFTQAGRKDGQNTQQGERETV
jgi:hypothetical protein